MKVEASHLRLVHPARRCGRVDASHTHQLRFRVRLQHPRYPPGSGRLLQQAALANAAGRRCSFDGPLVDLGRLLFPLPLSVPRPADENTEWSGRAACRWA